MWCVIIDETVSSACRELWIITSCNIINNSVHLFIIRTGWTRRGRREQLSVSQWSGINNHNPITSFKLHSNGPFWIINTSFLFFTLITCYTDIFQPSGREYCRCLFMHLYISFTAVLMVRSGSGLTQFTRPNFSTIVPAAPSDFLSYQSVLLLQTWRRVVRTSHQLGLRFLVLLPQTRLEVVLTCL